jgi:glycosyltransferase involved in cell wall biosynthesis
MAKRRILMVAPTCGTYGGIETFTAVIAQEVMASGEFDLRIVFRLRSGFTRQPNFDQGLADHGITWRVMEGGLDTQYFKDLLWADIINCHFPLIYATLPALILRKKLVVTIENKKHPFHGFLYHKPLSMAHARWYISSFVADTWGDDLKNPESKIIPAVSDLPNRWVDPAERHGFFFIARWIPGKGLEQLVDAYAAAEINHADHPLTLLGDGPLREEIEQRIQASGKSAFIQRPGFVSQDEKAVRMASSRWNVAPQSFPEDLGLSPIEARSCGVPSIVSNAGGLPEAGGVSSLKVIPGDVPSLRKALESAAHMPSSDYNALSSECRDSLKTYLAQPGFYTTEFHRILEKS